MVKDSPLAVKIDRIPVVYSLDTSGRRIFINDIEFADYNGDGIAKNFLNNAGVDLSGFDKEVVKYAVSVDADLIAIMNLNRSSFLNALSSNYEHLVQQLRRLQIGL